MRTAGDCLFCALHNPSAALWIVKDTTAPAIHGKGDSPAEMTFVNQRLVIL